MPPRVAASVKKVSTRLRVDPEPLTNYIQTVSSQFVAGTSQNSKPINVTRDFTTVYNYRDAKTFNGNPSLPWYSIAVFV
jgi:hypothetical protein